VTPVSTTRVFAGAARIEPNFKPPIPRWRVAYRLDLIDKLERLSLRSCAGRKFVPTLSLMAAGDADTLQVTHCCAAIGRQFLRINAERAQKLRQFGGGIRPFAGNELQFLSAQPDITGDGGHFLRPAVSQVTFRSALEYASASVDAACIGHSVHLG
jgi:hypothetical protein